MGKITLLVVISLLLAEMMNGQTRQHTLKGSVKDKDSNTVVVNAAITLISKRDSTVKYNTVSDSNGIFDLPGVLALRILVKRPRQNKRASGI